MRRLLLLGGGHAHVHVLREMGRERFAAAEVTLVTPFARQIYSGMVPGIVAGHYQADDAAIPLAPLAAAAGVAMHETAAVALDAARRQVRLADGRTLGYDVLSLDVGSDMDRGRLPGAREHAIFVRPIETFLAAVENVLDAAAERPLDIVIVGGGAAGVELALAFQFRLGLLGPIGARGHEAGRVALVVGGERVLPGYPEAVRRHAEQALDRNRVTLFRDTCTEVRADAVVLASGARVACDAPVIATGSEAPRWLAGSGLALDGQGYVVTGPTLQSGSHPEVFAAGDVTTRIDAPHPRSGVYAVRAGPPLLANLRAWCSAPGLAAAAATEGAATALTSGAPLKRYTPQARSLNILSCGQRRAIAARGNWVAAGRWVWWWKNVIDRRFVAGYVLPAAPAGAPAAPRAPVTPSAGTR
ncbi:MAG: FAD-dependent oxidoreductase [Rubrivivax sp.]|nr:FAD-dependent oxidoreductase [Rubrivivax sp.]